ncbi:hypothetical protein K438DRAFT_1749213 [Mycena galopus ATCC 62051]|nr:hypothetical protein K438DRAFT_1749213 [Mycena galopus ATCC 62051]
MCSFTELRDPSSHLPTSLLLALVAAIPNHAIRYFALTAIICFGVLCTIRLKSPTAQLHHLATMIDATDELLRRAMAQCPREANKMASLVKCRILTSARGWLSWTNYRGLSNSIAECVKYVKNIHTAVELTMEAENQRKIEDDINEMQFILAASSTQNTSYPESQYCAYRRAVDLKLQLPNLTLYRVVSDRQLLPLDLLLTHEFAFRFAVLLLVNCFTGLFKLPTHPTPNRPDTLWDIGDVPYIPFATENWQEACTFWHLPRDEWYLLNHVAKPDHLYEDLRELPFG